MQDKPRKTDEVATIEVYTDADWAGDAKSKKSTSSVFTRIDGLIIGMNAQLQGTHTQSSAFCEFHALGAGCAGGLYVKPILNDLGTRAKINLRCDAKAGRTFAQRQGLSKRTRRVTVKYLHMQDLVKARSRSVARTDRNESGGHRDETLARSQIGILQEFDRKELRERDDVPTDPGEQCDESDESSDDSQHG